uniref:Succinate dehydrogenase assembly factor 3 n=1 Tax=Trypanosoma congolense (strain IL3000) TaxID=1068625 RepID=G0V035_TRYCI|nr:conserved hypothetical protein [Trypanosoma congolense IL3000]
MRLDLCHGRARGMCRGVKQLLLQSVSCVSFSTQANTTGSGCRSGLRALPHPTELSSTLFRSEEWRGAMCHMYRTLYKLHVTKLQPVQREFGNRFIQAEFQRHIDAPEKHARIFYESWYSYAMQLSAGQTSRDMTAEEQRLLTEEQKETLRKLRSHAVQMKQHEPGFSL